MATNCLKIVFIFILIVFTPGCQKNIDYRDRYTGNFTFSINEDTGYPGGDSVHYDTAFNYAGMITKGTDAKQIKIYYTQNGWAEAIIGEDGTLSKPTSSGLGLGFSGKFETNDKITFIYVMPFAKYQNVIGMRR